MVTKAVMMNGQVDVPGLTFKVDPLAYIRRLVNQVNLTFGGHDITIAVTNQCVMEFLYSGFAAPLGPVPRPLVIEGVPFAWVPGAPADELAFYTARCSEMGIVTFVRVGTIQNLGVT